jgi:hypothetical protein
VLIAQNIRAKNVLLAHCTLGLVLIAQKASHKECAISTLLRLVIIAQKASPCAIITLENVLIAQNVRANNVLLAHCWDL